MALKSFVETKISENPSEDGEKKVVLLAFDFDYTLKVFFFLFFLYFFFYFFFIF